MTELEAFPEWLARLVPFERRMVTAGGQRFHVMEAGRGRPVWMLHGNPTWGFLWRKVAQALPLDRFRVVLPDLVGLGFSSKPKASEHTLENHVRWTGALLDTLGLEDLVFVGQDWGGPIGLGALAERPGRASGMVLLNTVVGPPRPGFRPTLFHRFAKAPLVSDLAFRGLGFPQRALHLAQGDKRSIRGDVARAYRWPLRGVSRNAAALALARMVPDSQRHPSIEPLRRAEAYVAGFAGPVEVVWGDADPVIGRALGGVRRVLPKAPVTRTRAGHYLQEEVPEEIAAAIQRVSAR